MEYQRPPDQNRQNWGFPHKFQIKQDFRGSLHFAYLCREGGVRFAYKGTSSYASKFIHPLLMYSKIFVSGLFCLLFALAVVATPQPRLEERQGIFHPYFFKKNVS